MLNMFMFAVIFVTVQIIGTLIMTRIMMNKMVDPKFMKNWFKKYMKLINEIAEDEDLDL